jgi:glycosyltransferase involved in cell wall biosynthesis
MPGGGLTSDRSRAHPAHPAQDGAPHRVLFIDYGVGFGGSIVSLSDLVEALLEENLATPLVITFQPSEFTEGRFPPDVVHRLRRLFHYGRKHALDKALGRSPLRIIRPLVMRGWVALDYLAEMALAVRLAFAGRRFGADLIHVNTGPERSATLAARLLGVPLVTHMRRFPSLDEGSEGRWLRRFDRDIAHYFAVSTAVATELNAAGVARGKVTVVHNSVRLREVRRTAHGEAEGRRKWGIADDVVVVGVFGRITDWKGQLDLLSAAATIAGECPRLMVMIIGDESDSDREYRDAVRAAAESDELRGRVVFTGYQRDVGSLYALCDIVVHCSNHPEPFGRVVIEAMAAGTPTIAMAEGGPLDIVTDGVDGLLVPPRDSGALATAIRRLHDEPALRERLGRAGLETVRARFSSAGAGQKIARHYAEILSQPLPR